MVLLKKVQDINIGDILMGDDSKSRKVLNISRGESIMYNIKQSNGNDYVVNDNHILCLKVVEGYPLDILGKKYYKDDIIDISVKNYLFFSKINKSMVLKGFKVGIEFKEKEVLLDPYILGFRLGNISEIDSNKYIYHIKHDYKINSKKIRLELLAGILDTNSCYLDNFKYAIILKSEQLSLDIQFISRSLGFNCNIINKNKTKNGIKIIYYHIYISGNKLYDIPCRIPNKQINNNDKLAMENNSLITDINIEKLKMDKYYGFGVDGNHRFLLGDFTVTHNSTLISDVMYYHRTVPYGLIMSGTEEGNGFYGKYFPDLFIHNGFKKDILQTLINRQKKVLKNPDSNPHAFLLIDDCMYDKGVTRDKNMRLIFMKW